MSIKNREITNPTSTNHSMEIQTQALLCKRENVQQRNITRRNPPSILGTVSRRARFRLYSRVTICIYGPPQEFHIDGYGTRKSHAVAYFHQIHCIVCLTLGSLAEIWTYKKFEAKIITLYGNARFGIGKLEEDDEHMAHCVGVLRQAIMCSANTMLENRDDR